MKSGLLHRRQESHHLANGGSKNVQPKLALPIFSQTLANLFRDFPRFLGRNVDGEIAGVNAKTEVFDRE